MRLATLATLLLVVGCGGAGEPPPPMALTDTLGGYRLGMTRTEAEAAGVAQGDSLRCEAARAQGAVRQTRCRWGTADGRLELLNDQLVSIRLLPAPEGAGMRPAEVESRLAAGGYGPPAFDLHGENVSYPFRSFWVGSDSSSRLELFCPDTVAATGCQLVSRLATPKQIRRLAPAAPPPS